MEAVGSSETLVAATCKTTRCHSLEDRKQYFHSSENVKCPNLIFPDSFAFYLDFFGFKYSSHHLVRPQTRSLSYVALVSSFRCAVDW